MTYYRAVKHHLTHWSEKYFDLLHCRSSIQNVCYELQESLLLFILQSDSLRTTEDLPVGITYIGEVSENGRIKERMTKNVERKEIKEVREAAHNTPSLNVTKRSERPCDQKIRKTWRSGQHISPKLFLQLIFPPPPDLAQEIPSYVMVKIQKQKENIPPGKLPRHPLQKITAGKFSIVCLLKAPPATIPAPHKSWKIQLQQAGSSKNLSLLPAQRLILLENSPVDSARCSTKTGINTPGALPMPRGERSSHDAVGAEGRAGVQKQTDTRLCNHQGQLLREDTCPLFIVLLRETFLSWQADSIPDCI